MEVPESMIMVAGRPEQQGEEGACARRRSRSLEVASRPRVPVDHPEPPARRGVDVKDKHADLDLRSTAQPMIHFRSYPVAAREEKSPGVKRKEQRMVPPTALQAVHDPGGVRDTAYGCSRRTYWAC